MRRDAKRGILCLVLVLVLLGSMLFAILFNILPVPDSHRADPLDPQAYASRPATDDDDEPTLAAERAPAPIAARAVPRRAMAFDTKRPLAIPQAQLGNGWNGTASGAHATKFATHASRGRMLERRAANGTNGSAQAPRPRRDGAQNVTAGGGDQTTRAADEKCGASGLYAMLVALGERRPKFSAVDDSGVMKRAADATGDAGRVCFGMLKIFCVKTKPDSKRSG